MVQLLPGLVRDDVGHGFRGNRGKLGANIPAPSVECAGALVFPGIGGRKIFSREWGVAIFSHMQSERLKLAGFERVKYFAPVAICGYLAALCVALIITSAFLENMKDAIAITAAGLFGLVVSGALGAVILRVQLRELRYVVVPTQGDPEENFQAVGRLAETSGWHVTANEPGRCLEARTPGSVLSEGEIVAVKFRQHDVLVASICDPGVGFSLVGRRRCTQNRELVRLAVSAGEKTAVA